jgi:hypothetical protein
MTSDQVPPDQRTTPAPIPGTQSNLWPRVLYMVVFALVFWILCWMLAVTAVLQLVLTLLSTRPNADLVRFGAGLAIYSRQIIDFLTFVSDKLPFPFGEWPHVDTPAS